MNKKILFLISTIFCTSLLAIPPELGLSFPPVSNVEQVKLTVGYMKDLNLKQVRLSDNWKHRELSLNKFNFTTVVSRVKTLRDSGFKVTLTMESDAPSWRCDTSRMNVRGCVFKDTAVFRLYAKEWIRQVKPYVSIVQFGNEWSSSYFYPGSIGSYAVSSKIFCQEANKQSVPCALGGHSIGLVRTMVACNGAIDHYMTDDGYYYTDLVGSPIDLSDICATPTIKNNLNSVDSVMRTTNAQYIDIHLYHDAEDWNKYVDFFQKRYVGYGKKWIISEFGGIGLFAPQDENSRSIRTKMQLESINRMVNVEASMYFQLYEDTTSTSPYRSYLIDSNLVISPSYYQFKNFTK